MATQASGPYSGSFSMTMAPGTDFGPRYRIDSLLGEGGMGTVYKAFDKELGRTVAIKLVRPEFAASPNAMQRFRQELLLASKVTHKNVLRIHDLGDVGGLKFISMAYVEGQDLHGLLEKSGRLTIPRALQIARQFCAALEAAHDEGVVHRDLKPQNILIDSADNIYVSDFGLAKSLESEGTMMTRTGQVLGTPRYMSPEQVEARPADHRSDLYSFGLILYEMVTGEIPFKADSAMQLMYQRVTQKPKSPKLVNPDLPDYLARIIMRCLEKEPDKRYQSAREILNGLDAAQAPSRSIAIQIPRIQLSPSSRVPVLVTAGLALVAGIVVVAVPPLRKAIFERAPVARQTGAPVPVTRDRYLAVLPFELPAKGSELKYAADGVVEALSAKLSGLKNIYVASPAAVETAIGKEKASTDKIARNLGVSLIVGGAFEAAGDRIKIAVRLEDAARKKILWSEDFTGLPQDLLTIEDQIYSKLVKALDLKPSNEELARSSTRPTEDIGAYQLYLKGRNVLRGKRDAKTVNTAMNLYNQATKKDPNFALAYAGLADACLLMYDLTKDGFWSERALGAANQGQRLNDEAPEIHVSLGGVYLATGKTAEAVAEIQRALELAPNSDDGYRKLGGAYRDAGRQTEAIRALQKAVEINPYYWFNYNQLGVAYVQAGTYDKALEAFRKVTELEPDRASGYGNIGVVYYRQGKWDQSIPAFQKAIELSPTFRYYSNLGVAYFYLGKYAEAAGMFQKAVDMNPSEFLAVGNLADAYRWLGQKDKAAAAYERAIGLAFKAFEVNPRKASTLGSLAAYYAKKGELGRASEYIRRARAIDPNENSLIYKEAVIDTLSSKPALALEALKEALAKG